MVFKTHPDHFLFVDKLLNLRGTDFQEEKRKEDSREEIERKRKIEKKEGCKEEEKHKKKGKKMEGAGRSEHSGEKERQMMGRGPACTSLTDILCYCRIFWSCFLKGTLF